MKLEEGKSYITKEGVEVGPMRPNTNRYKKFPTGDKYPWTYGGGSNCFTDSGECSSPYREDAIEREVDRGYYQSKSFSDVLTECHYRYFQR